MNETQIFSLFFLLRKNIYMLRRKILPFGKNPYNSPYILSIFFMQYIKRIFFFLLTNMAVLALLSIVMMVVNYFFPGLLSSQGDTLSLLIYAAVIGFAGSIISLLLSKWMAKKAYNIVLLDAMSAQQDKKLAVVWNTVERIAQAEGVTMPEVGYYNSAEPNAFATGASKNSSLVAVSTGLLSQMDAGEIEGVVGHEMAHVLNGDMVTLTLIQGVVNTFVIFLSNIVARFVASALARDNEGMSMLTFNALYLVFQLVFGFLASFVIMWFSRMREYRADLGGAKYTSKSKMIAGLKRLQAMTSKLSEPRSPEEKKMAAFMINEPDSLFSTHPSLDNRIRALEENYQLA